MNEQILEQILSLRQWPARHWLCQWAGEWCDNAALHLAHARVGYVTSNGVRWHNVCEQALNHMLEQADEEHYREPERLEFLK